MIFDKRKFDPERILECFKCLYFDECYRTVEKPEDNSDGSCKTKEQFIKQTKGLS